MKFPSFLIFLLIPILSNAQDNIKEVVLKSDIEAVKIHLQGAEITRNYMLELAPGKYNIVFSELSPKLYEKTVQLTASNDLEILSLTAKTNFLKRRKDSPKIKVLRDSVNLLKTDIDALNNERNAYFQEKTLLDKNQNLSNFHHEPGGTVDLGTAADFYRERVLKINKSLTLLRNQLEKAHRSLFDVKLQMIELNAGQQPTSEIYLLVECSNSVNIPLSLSYIVGDAGWSAIYDLKAGKIGKAAQLAYKARAYNNTGVDWNDVKLTLSTSDPIQSITQPELEVWDIAKSSQYGMEKIATTNIEQTIQTQDLNPNRGNVFKDEKRGSIKIEYEYEEKAFIDINFVKGLMEGMYDAGFDYRTDRYKAYMQEQAKAASPTIALSTIDLPDLNSDFSIDKPYTIPSDNKPYTIKIKQEALPVSYGYYTIPKLDHDAFLVAKLTDWEDMELISGPVNIYNQNTYIGQSYINIRNLTDTLMLSLGRDSKVMVSRNKIKGASKKVMLGAYKKIELTYEITIQNAHSEAIDIIIEDQIPVSDDKEVTIQLLESSKADHQEDIGALSWQIALAPGEKKTLSLSFSVKYPKNKRVQVQFSKSRSYASPRF